MFKCTFLLPGCDNDGSEFRLEKLEDALKEVSTIAGGFTAYPICGGGWGFGDDTKIEPMMPVVVVVENKATVARLRELVSYLCFDFHQDCIYFEVQEVDVEFVCALESSVPATIGEAVQKAEDVTVKSMCDKSCELGGQLPWQLVEFLGEAGCVVDEYTQKGVTSTVIRFPEGS
jgi:hypothetical protein